MMNNKEMIEKLKMNIAVSNFKTELNANEESKEYALKNEKRICRNAASHANYSSA